MTGAITRSASIWKCTGVVLPSKYYQQIIKTHITRTLTLEAPITQEQLRVLVLKKDIPTYDKNIKDIIIMKDKGWNILEILDYEDIAYDIEVQYSPNSICNAVFEQNITQYLRTTQEVRHES